MLFFTHQKKKKFYEITSLTLDLTSESLTGNFFCSLTNPILKTLIVTITNLTYLIIKSFYLPHQKYSPLSINSMLKIKLDSIFQFVY